MQSEFLFFSLIHIHIFFSFSLLTLHSRLLCSLSVFHITYSSFSSRLSLKLSFTFFIHKKITRFDSIDRTLFFSLLSQSKYCFFSYSHDFHLLSFKDPKFMYSYCEMLFLFSSFLQKKKRKGNKNYVSLFDCMRLDECYYVCV